MTIYAVTNGNVVLENRILWNGVILIEDGIITQVGESHNIIIPSCAHRIDAKGAYVGPGFVDIHRCSYT